MRDAVTENILTDIDRLAALQEFDRRLKEQRDRMAALVNEADEFEVELSRQRAAVSALASERDALEQRRAELDRQLDISGLRIRDNRMRMNRVRNSVELLALQREIDLSKEANAQVEEELLRIMETLEGLAGQLSTAEEALAGLETRAAEVVGERRAQADSLRQEVDAALGEREILVRGMDASLRSKYEQIFERRGGSAVVAAVDGICTGCRMHVPPQFYNELQKFRDIRQCPNCHRILYWRPPAAA
jgi:predicted  nucleic acid-binding Zn-ribbon protein